MPRVIDPVQRRHDIIESVYDVILESGIENVSLRKVADAAGLVIGSVRHTFATREDLIRAACDELVHRIGARLEAHRDSLAPAANRVPVIVDMLAELLPLDAVSAREVPVWLEIVTASRTDPVVRDAAQQLSEGADELASIIVRRLTDLPPTAQQIEAHRLAALIDGLALRSTTTPLAVDPRQVIQRHLEQLANSPGGQQQPSGSSIQPRAAGEAV